MARARLTGRGTRLTPLWVYTKLCDLVPVLLGLITGNCFGVGLGRVVGECGGGFVGALGRVFGGCVGRVFGVLACGCSGVCSGAFVRAGWRGGWCVCVGCCGCVFLLWCMACWGCFGPAVGCGVGWLRGRRGRGAGGGRGVSAAVAGVGVWWCSWCARSGAARVSRRVLLRGVCGVWCGVFGGVFRVGFGVITSNAGVFGVLGGCVRWVIGVCELGNNSV